jgi:hypothetical protein
LPHRAALGQSVLSCVASGCAAQCHNEHSDVPLGSCCTRPSRAAQVAPDRVVTGCVVPGQVMLVSRMPCHASHVSHSGSCCAKSSRTSRVVPDQFELRYHTRSDLTGCIVSGQVVLRFMSSAHHAVWPRRVMLCASPRARPGKPHRVSPFVFSRATQSNYYVHLGVRMRFGVPKHGQG